MNRARCEGAAPAEPPDLAANMPSDYRPGYERARAIDPERTSCYIAHTLMGDPVADAAVEDLTALGRDEVARFIAAGMNGVDDSVMNAAPATLREFFRSAEIQPDWLHHGTFMPGIRMFHRNSYLILMAFVTGVLIEGFMTTIAKSFLLTGRLRDKGVRRLGQNNRHMTEIFFPGGLDRYSDGWKLSVRIRLIHGHLRRLLNDSDEWDSEAWGTPISAAHLGFAISAFSARLLKHIKTLGGSYNQEEYDSFMAVWRYAGYLMGIPETILFRDAEDALRLYQIGVMCEPEPGVESIAMAHALVNSAPIVAGVTVPTERQALARYVYRVSRGLLGNRAAESLRYPDIPVRGAVFWIRQRARFGRMLDKMSPHHRKASSFNRFGYLLAASTFDNEGINYRLPDHVFSERAGEW